MSSGLAVSYTAGPAGVCTVSGATLTLVGTGSCTVTAQQAGNTNYNAATDVPQTFTINTSGTTTVAGDVTATFSTGTQTVTLSAAVTSGAGTVNGGTVTFTPTFGTAVSGTVAAGAASATFTIPAGQAAAAYNYTAVYSGAGGFAGSADNTNALTIGKANQTITFANPGNKILGVAPFAISATAGSGLPVGFTSLTTSVCTVSGTTVTLVAAGTCTIRAAQAGNANYNAAADVQQSFLVSLPMATVSLKVLTNGGDGAFTFASTPASALSTTVATSGGAGQTSPISIVAGTYTVSVTPPHGFGFTAISCNAASSTSSASARTATFTVGNGDTVICTFSAANSLARTAETIQRFMSRRNDLIVSTGPDESRQIDRLREFAIEEGAQSQGPAQGFASSARPSSAFAPPAATMGQSALPSFAATRLMPQPPSTDRLLGRNFETNPEANRMASGAGLPFGLMMQTEGTPTTAFSMSWRQVMRYNDDVERRRMEEASQGLGLASGAMPQQRRAPSPFDIWFEGRATSFTDDRNRQDMEGYFRVFYLGADYVISRWLLVGVMGQYDQMRMRSEKQGYDIAGDGWMAGPYTTIRLSKNLYFQGRAAWGTSSNTVSPYLSYRDKFDTDRWLAKGTLQGQYEYGNLHLRPSASIGYIEDTSRGYTDSLGVFIPRIRNSLGQLTFGPEIAYRQPQAGGGWIEPRAKFDVIWNFARETSTVISASEFASAPVEWRGRAELGLRMQGVSGIVLDLAGSYDGIGSSGYQATTGRATVRIPLQ